MSAPPIPPDERERLGKLNALGILDTPPEAAFDDLVRIAAELCAVPYAYVSFVDAERQWFKARVGFERGTTSRQLSFCAHALTEPGPLVVQDLTLDPRFCDNPMVVGEPRFRFYATFPLRVGDGSAVGTLCLLDRVTRTLSASQLAAFRSIAGYIQRELELRRRLASSQPDAEPTAIALAEGDRVGDGLTIVRLLGRGAVGSVYEAAGSGPSRAAIKVLHPEWLGSEAVVERFTREARILSRLASPHVCRLLDVGNLDDARGRLPYLLLEYLDGLDLARVLKRERRVGWRRATAWIASACRGAGEAHAAGIVHRDIKPSNVFVGPSRGSSDELGASLDDKVTLLDFGIAKSIAQRGAPADPSLTQVEGPVGTPCYMAPEQVTLTHPTSAATDVWSLGATLYELVTGEVPFPGRTDMEVCAAVLARPHRPLASYDDTGAPKDLSVIVDRCLRKSPAARYGTVADLARDLHATIALPCSAGGVVSSRPPGSA